MEIEKRGDIHMIRQALTQGWVTDPEKREALRKQIEDLAADESTKPRSRLAAINTILAAERLHLAERELMLKEKALGGADDDAILGVVGEIMRMRNEKVVDDE